MIYDPIEGLTRYGLYVMPFDSLKYEVSIEPDPAGEWLRRDDVIERMRLLLQPLPMDDEGAK
jgi:hypothetical protein